MGRGGREAAEAVMDDPVLVYSTFPTREKAEIAATAVVDTRLAACVNLVPGVSSIYRWQGTIQRVDEVLLIAKTRASRAAALVEGLRVAHPFEVPDIVVLPIVAGDPAYLAWIAKETEEPIEV
jgi:periplasmic divalent cation tolerance protein